MTDETLRYSLCPPVPPHLGATAHAWNDAVMCSGDGPGGCMAYGYGSLLTQTFGLYFEHDDGDPAKVWAHWAYNPPLTDATPLRQAGEIEDDPCSACSSVGMSDSEDMLMVKGPNPFVRSRITPNTDPTSLASVLVTQSNDAERENTFRAT